MIKILGNFSPPKYLVESVSNTPQDKIGDFVNLIEQPKRYIDLCRQSGYVTIPQENGKCLFLVDDQGVPMHTDEHYSVVWFVAVSGIVQLVTENGFVDVHCGDAFWLDTTKPHGVIHSNGGRWACVSCYVDPIE